MNKVDATIRMRAPRGWRRFFQPPVRDGVWCRLSPDSTVTVYSGDMSVLVERDGGSVHSAHDGRISFTRASDGQRFSVATAPLYLAAAERQGIPIRHVDGYGYYS